MSTKDETSIATSLSQWQVCVEMANSVSQRRDNMNNIFVTLNLAILAAISFVWNIKSVFLLIARIVLCIIWLVFIRNFKALNQAKFKVILELEKQLSTAPFEKEWNILCKDKKYRDGTKLEQALPVTFICIYVVAIIMIFVSRN